MDNSGHNDFIFCYWDDLGSTKEDHFNYFNYHAASARSKDYENGMAILHQQGKEEEDRSTAATGCPTIRELREYASGASGSETQGENNLGNDRQV